MMYPESAGDRPSQLSAAVVRAVAAAEEVDPISLHPPLYRVVDPDAVDALFRDATDCVVRFTYRSHDVEVHADGTVLVDGSRYEGD